MKPSLFATAALFASATFTPTIPAPVEASSARLAPARLVRYPHAHGSKIAFTYLGDIWTADESGGNARRLTVHPERDVYYGVPPDILVAARPEDHLANHDRQLERAVQELLKEPGPRQRATGPAVVP